MAERPDDAAFQEKPARPPKGGFADDAEPRPVKPAEADDAKPRLVKPVEGVQPHVVRQAAPPRDDDDWDDDRPRRRRPRPRDDDDNDAVSTLIPYKNGMALAAYYVGLFGLVPCLGVVLGPLGIIFGIVGLRRVKAEPRVKGTGHAIAGIVLGGIGLLYHLVVFGLMFAGIIFSNRR